MLYSSTTFVFATPVDAHCFQLVVSPKGLASVRSLIIASDRVDEGLFCPNNTQRTQFTLKEWEGAFHDLQKMLALRELQVWLIHRNTKELNSVQVRRPWKEGTGNEAVEQRHRKLFDVLGTARVNDFTVSFTWNPEDLLKQHEWPFKAKLQTKYEMASAMEELPDLTEPDLYD